MNKRKTTEEFIADAKLVHGDKYDYSNSMYINKRSFVLINCFKHGGFNQMANVHLRGHGCPECGKDSKKQNLSWSTEQFIEKAKAVHGDKYDYSKVCYVSAKTNVTILCLMHGEFEQNANNHIQGNGCPLCAILTIKKSQENFISQITNIHGNKFNYDKVIYTGIKNKIIIICPIHGEFIQTAENHLVGSGCPSCAKNGFQPSKPAYLYYLKITTDTNQILYKLGITNRTVNERFNLTDLAKIEIVKQKLYDNGQDALDWETKLKRMYKKYQYKGPDILSSGNTELFTEDIIAMWDSN